MSAGSTILRQASTASRLPNGHPSNVAANSLDDQLVQATRNEIHRLAHEITQLAQTDIAPNEFFGRFLDRVVRALASVAGAYWVVDDEGAARLAAEVNLSNSGIDPEGNAHRQLLAQAVVNAQLEALAPGSAIGNGGTGSSPGTNPTNHLLLLAPVRVEGRVVGLVEIFQRAGRGLATERGYRQFLASMTQRAGEYLVTHRLRQLSGRGKWAGQLEQFLTEIHRNLSVRQTAYAIVNESRRLLSCDRVSLALGRGRQCRLVAVSGLDSLDRRAAQVRQLARLASRTLATGETVWLDRGGDDLAPQVESLWDQYVDQSHVRQCGVIPLTVHSVDDHAPGASDPVGALIIEQMVDETPRESLEASAAQLAQHSAAALAHCLEHERIFLLPLWRGVGRICEAIGGRHFLATLLAIALAVASVVALATVPADFTLPARGTLQPAEQRTVFAREDGVIDNVLVQHGQLVRAGQTLVQMRNTDLDVEFTSLVGKQTTTREHILSVQRSLLDNPRLDVEQQNRLSGELLQLQQAAESIHRQLQLVQRKQQQLVLRADRSGQIITWKVRDKLAHRPVQKGQALMAVVDPAGSWELELFVPERHAGHLLEAASRTEEPLSVTFMLASHPDQEFHGQVKEVDCATTAREQQGNTVRIRVAIDKEQIPALRTDATVVARVHCGTRSLGYTWFHDLVDTLQASVLFWL